MHKIPKKIIISIIVPTFNSESTIEQCLKAIRKSSFSNFELIVIDDGSSDDSIKITNKYADKIINNSKNLGKTKSRQKAIKIASGHIIVNIDSDVIIDKDSLKIIDDFFKLNPEYDAITGVLAENTPYKDYLSQYKNLYMNYYFNNLPTEVTFLYGSIFAIRRRILKHIFINYESNYGEDTALGQQLTLLGKKIACNKDLTVTHLRHYSLKDFIKNEFIIPHEWARLFLLNKGASQLGKNGRFAHASLGQIFSLLLSPLVLLFTLLTTTHSMSFFAIWIFLFCAWFLINMSFLNFLYQKRGMFFCLISMVTIFVDDLIKFTGVFSGGIVYFFSILKNEKPF